LADVLRQADPDPWRQRVRDALGRKDWLALENIAKSPDLDRQPAATVAFLCARSTEISGRFLDQSSLGSEPDVRKYGARCRRGNCVHASGGRSSTAECPRNHESGQRLQPASAF
jgi:hypothetical protein